MNKEWMDAVTAMQPIEALTKEREALFACYEQLPHRKLPWHHQKPSPLTYTYDFFEETGEVYNFVDHDVAALALTKEGDLVATEVKSNTGIVVADLFQSLLNNEHLLSYFGQLMDKETKEGAFHYMTVNHGLFLYIPDQTVLKEPILLKGLLENIQATHVSHLLIIIGNHCQVTINDDFSIQGDRTIHRVTEVYVGNDTTLSYIRHCKGKNTGQHHDEFVMRLAKNSICHYDGLYHVEEDGFFVTRFHLEKEGARLIGHEVAIAKDNAKLYFNTEIVHCVKHTDSQWLSRGVAFGHSRLYFNAMSRIKEQATGANALQNIQLLLMDEQSQGEANPMLDICHHEVKASHGAVIRQMDEATRYYLMSRGLTKEEADALYVEGLLKEYVPQELHSEVKEALSFV